MRYEIGVIGTWSLRRSPGQVVAVRQQVARVVACLALNAGSQRRSLIANNIWPEVSDQRASANLRSALWHGRAQAPGLLDADESDVWLDDVVVDLDRAVEVARTLLAGDGAAHVPAVLFHDLLPSWHEEWLELPRFVHHHLRLQAIEQAIEARLDSHSVESALVLARQLAGREPLRESTHRLLARCQLAAGLYEDASRTCEGFVHRVRDVVGAAPSPLLDRLWSEIR